MNTSTFLTCSHSKTASLNLPHQHSYAPANFSQSHFLSNVIQSKLQMLNLIKILYTRTSSSNACYSYKTLRIKRDM